MKGIRIDVAIGPYEAGSMTLGQGGVSIDIEVEEGDSGEIQEVVKRAIDEALKAQRQIPSYFP